MTRRIEQAARGREPSRLAWIAAAVALLLPPLAPLPASAAALVTPHLRAELVSETRTIQPGQAFWVALHFILQDGWHTYWQNPGDSGSPPRVDWQLPQGFAASAIHWPYPERIPVGPLMNFGYSGDAWMLVHITPPQDLASNKTLSLVARAEWLVCKEECIPESGSLTLQLPVSKAGTAPSDQAAGLAEARQRLPQPVPWPASLEVDGNSVVLQVAAPGLQRKRIADTVFFPFYYGVVEHAAAQARVVNERGLHLRLTRGDLRSAPLQGLRGVLVITERLPDGPLSHAFTIDAAPYGAPQGLNLWFALLFAMAGGLLLNVMPCVFPVLSIKALAIVEQARRSPAEARRSGIAFTAGVLSTFCVLAVGLIALRAGGEAVGWGFQLQAPAFVLLLAWLMFALGLMLSGVWSAGEGAMGLGDRLAARRGHTGSFFTGALAVVVATPCTAPFMGAALAFALSQPPALAVSVFLVMGLGLALPWLGLSLWPAAQRWLPPPGAWMERFKQVLAFPMYASAAWLLWVLAQQTAAPGLAAALGGMVLIGFSAWAWQQTRRAGTVWRRVGNVVVAGAIAVLAGLLWLPQEAGRPSLPEQGSLWEPFSPERLDQLRAKGQPVFVNFTAAWCITCLVNERVALNSSRVTDTMRANGVAYLKGDWTRRDADITRMLERFGRSGVPLYILYPPGEGRSPEVLPPLLTEALILKRLEELNRPRPES